MSLHPYFDEHIKMKNALVKNTQVPIQIDSKEGGERTFFHDHV